MKKILGIACILCIALTFWGAGYVLLSKGQANAGYAVVPMVCALALSTVYRSAKK